MMWKAVGSRASLHAGRFLAILVPIAGFMAMPGRAVGSQPRLVPLPPALKIGDKAPEDWTHLVMKSVPRLASGDLDSLPSIANKTATMFHTVMLADVQPLGMDKQFILTRVGLGFTMPDGDDSDQEVVVSSDRLEAMGIKLSKVERLVLEEMESELAESRIIAFTSSFALLRSPAMLVYEGRHEHVDLYYAFCVDPATGKLRVGAWSMWPGDVKQPPPPSVIEVAPKTVYRCAVDVKAKRVLGLVPYSWTFAMQKLPPGQLLGIKQNKGLGEKIVAIARHPNEVNTEEFEKMLRKVLFSAPKIPDAKSIPKPRTVAR